MAAEFTDNLTEYLEDKLKEFNPDLSVGEGTAIRDLFIKPFTVVFQPIVDEILRIRQNLSLEDAETLADEDLDRLAANFFVTRKPGSKATGVARIFFSEPVDEFIAQGTVFLAANGVRFLALSDNTITTSGLRLNTFGDLFFFDVNVEAESTGISGNIAENLLSDIESGSDKIVEVSNTTAFTGGTETETNEELISRLAIAITFRNLINKPGAKLILLENFQRLLDVLVVGFADRFTVVQEILGIANGTRRLFELSENEDILEGSVGVFVTPADELVATGPLSAGFYPLAFDPFVASTLQLRAGSTFTGGTPLVAGTHFLASQTVSLLDEFVGTGNGINTLYQLDFFPLVSGTLELRSGATFLTGVALTDPTHYSVNLLTGLVTLTPAGVLFLGLNQLHAKYTATTTNPAAFALLEAGATLVNGTVPPDLRASYRGGPLGPAYLPPVGFDGVVHFLVAPPSGTTVTADFTYYLMRRDRVSGNNIVLGDDTFGTVNNLHIGGKVDFYLKFLGLEEKEVRINGLKASNMLFPQGPSDPAPSGTLQYVTTTLPLIDVLNLEKVDPGTNLPSGIFLTRGQAPPAELVGIGDGVATLYQLDNFPVNTGSLVLRVGDPFTGTILNDPADYTVNLATGLVTLTGAGVIALGASRLYAKYNTGEFAISILPGKLNLNLSGRQKVELQVYNATYFGSDFFFRYYTHQDFASVQAFVDDETNRIVTADLLARAPLPIFVDMEVNYSRVEGGPSPEEIVQTLTTFINSQKIGKCLSVFDIAEALSGAGVEFVQLPITLTGEFVKLDFRRVTVVTTNRIDVPPNSQFVARTITVNEVPLSSCDAI